MQNHMKIRGGCTSNFWFHHNILRRHKRDGELKEPSNESIYGKLYSHKEEDTGG